MSKIIGTLVGGRLLQKETPSARSARPHTDTAKQGPKAAAKGPETKADPPKEGN